LIIKRVDMVKENKTNTEKENKDDTKVNVEFSEQNKKESSEQSQEELNTQKEEIKNAELSEEEQLKLKVEELEDKLLRTTADFENYKKRLLKRSEEQIEYASDRMIIDILEVVDNFERAMEHGSKDSDVDSLYKGMELIYNQLVSFLNKYNVKKLDAVGEIFDPEYHEALMQIESEEFPEGTVAVEINKGYLKNNKVLRHSKVGVSNGEEKKESKKKDK